MKKDITPQTAEIPQNGIKITYKEVFKKTNPALNFIINLLFSYGVMFCLNMGAIYTFITMFEFPIHSTLFPIVAAVITLISTLIFSLKKTPLLIAVSGISAAVITLFFVFLSEISSGMLYLRDIAIQGIYKSMRWPVASLAFSADQTIATETTFSLILIFIILSLLVGFFAVRKTQFVIPALITFCFFEIGAAFGCVPNHIAFGFLLAGWTGLFAMSVAVKTIKFKARKGDKKGKKTNKLNHKKSFVSLIGLLIAAVTFFTFLTSNYFITKAGYDRPENMKILRTEFKEKSKEFLDWLLGRDPDGTLNEGKLYALEEREYKNRRQLTVEVPYSSSIYLKGYVGEDYSGDMWQGLNNQAEYSQMYSLFKETGYYPQTMQGLLLRDLEINNSIVKKSAATVTVKDIKTKKSYAYLAYTPLIPSSFKVSGESTVIPSDISEYSYNAYIDDQTTFYMNLADLYYNKDFSKAMSTYTQYVKTEYVNVPEDYEDVKQIVADLIDGEKYGYSMGAGSNLEVADRIRTWLANNTEYNLEATGLPNDTDFVKNFIFSSKQGYAPHYATALAVMLRLANVPTRYVEGFIITSEDYANVKAKKDGYYELDLTDYNSHAWIEVYEKNYGWISIEATPGYYSESLLDQYSSFEDPEKLEGYEEYPEDPEGEQEEYTVDGEINLDSDSELSAMLPPETETKDDLVENQTTALERFLKVIKYTAIFVAAFVLGFVVLALITFIVLVIRRKVRLSLLRSDIKIGNRNRKMGKIYRYYSRLLRFERIENTENLPYMQFAEKICRESKLLRDEQHLKAMTLFLKHSFDREPLTENQLECLARLIGDYQNNALIALPPKEKFVFMYIENLG